MNKVTDLFSDNEPKKEKQIVLEDLLESCLHCDFELKKVQKFTKDIEYVQTAIIIFQYQLDED